MKSVISEKKQYEEIKKRIKGSENFFVLSDFDRTMTYGSVNGVQRPSVTSLLRRKDNLSEKYTKRSQALFEKYHPIEIDPKISDEEKKAKIGEWRKLHNELFIEEGLSKENFKMLIENEDVGLREGVSEFLDYLYKKQIPLVIFSASSCGELIKLFLEKEKRNYPNIYYIINKFRWDKNGKAVSPGNPIIHAMNKDEVSLKDFSDVKEAVKDRVNAILLGDNLADLGLVRGFSYDNLLKIGFLNLDYNKNKKDYEKSFHVVLDGDDGFSFVNDLVKELA